MIEPKLKLQAFIAVFREWFDAWLDSGPDRALVQLAHAQIGDIYTALGRRLKDKVGV